MDIIPYQTITNNNLKNGKKFLDMGQSQGGNMEMCVFKSQDKPGSGYPCYQEVIDKYWLQHADSIDSLAVCLIVFFVSN